MKKLTVLLVAVISSLVWYANPAFTDLVNADDGVNRNARLHGVYAFTLTRVCATGRGTAENPLFTPPPDLTLLRSANPETRVIQGILYYNGDGTGSVEGGRHLGVSANQAEAGLNPIRQNEFTCTLTYQVNADDSFTQWMSCISSRIAGPVVGDVFEGDGVVLQGQIIKAGKTLVLSDTDINVEDFTRDRDGAITHWQRICGRSGTAVKVKSGSGD